MYGYFGKMFEALRREEEERQKENGEEKMWDEFEAMYEYNMKKAEELLGGKGEEPTVQSTPTTGVHFGYADFNGDATKAAEVNEEPTVGYLCDAVIDMCAEEYDRFSDLFENALCAVEKEVTYQLMELLRNGTRYTEKELERITKTLFKLRLKDKIDEIFNK